MAISEPAVQIAPEVNKFISTQRKMLIDGQWVEAASGRRFPCTTPQQVR